MTRRMMQVRVVRPRVKVFADAAGVIETKLQEFLDQLREDGVAEGVELLVSGSKSEGVVVVVRYHEVEALQIRDAETGEIVSQESPSGLTVPPGGGGKIVT